MLDWRVLPLKAWLSWMVKSPPGLSGRDPGDPPEPLVVLSKSDFAEAVREAIRVYAAPYKLRHNPLLQTKVARGRRTSDPVEALRATIREANALGRGSRMGNRYALAVEATYLRPARTQAEAAEALDFPYGTYRRYLQRGIEQVTDLLWRWENDEPRPSPPTSDPATDCMRATEDRDR